MIHQENETKHIFCSLNSYGYGESVCILEHGNYFIVLCFGLLLELVAEIGIEIRQNMKIIQIIIQGNEIF